MKTSYGKMTRKEQKTKINTAIRILKEVAKGTYFYGSNLTEVIAIAQKNLK